MLIGVEEFEVLLEHEDILGPVVPGEGGRDLGRRGLTPVVPMLREGLAVRLAANDVRENAQAGDTTTLRSRASAIPSSGRSTTASNP